MKKFIAVILILFLFTGCSYIGDNNINHAEGFDYTDSEEISELRYLYFGNMSPLRFAVLKEIILNSTVDLKKYYRYEYNGGEIETVYLDYEIDEIGQIIECVDNENVKEDIFRVYALLKYADENNSQPAFDAAYEILETLNAYLFNYPLTQSIFSGWELYVDAADMDEFYPYAVSFGYDYTTDEMELALKNTDMPKDYELKNKIEAREKETDKQTIDLKNNNTRVFEYMHSVSQYAERLKFAANNYVQDDIYSYQKNVNEAIADLDSETDKLLSFLKEGDIKQEYIALSELIKTFENKFKDNYTNIDILSDINEIYYKAIKPEYLYCGLDNNWLNENIILEGITRELDNE